MEWDGEATELTPPVGERDHARGPAGAAATLVVYGDYECPYTRRAHQTLREVQAELGDRLRVVYRHFPLTAIHPHALHAAEAAEAAAAQGRFWEMHDRLFSRQLDLADTDLGDYAADLGLDVAAFTRDMSEHAHLARVEEDVESGLRSGVEGTPTLFLNGRRHGGGFEKEALLVAVGGG